MALYTRRQTASGNLEILHIRAVQRIFARFTNKTFRLDLTHGMVWTTLPKNNPETPRKQKFLWNGRRETAEKLKSQKKLKH